MEFGAESAQGILIGVCGVTSGAPTSWRHGWSHLPVNWVWNEARLIEKDSRSGMAIMSLVGSC